jgi:hypothetical protein
MLHPVYRVLAVAVLALLPSRTVGETTIRFDRGAPSSTSAGRVGATGTFDHDSKYLLNYIKLDVVPAGGGLVRWVVCQVDPRAKTWVGQLTDVPPGRYVVFGWLALVDQDGKDIYYGTAVAEVVVE